MITDAVSEDSTELRASMQDGTYPRPQLLRPAWADLSGAWKFQYDDADEGRAARWHVDPHFGSTIAVPFPPESAASGIHDTTHHTVAWYHREIQAADLAAAGPASTGERVLLHFGAVDYRCGVWLNGVFLGGHEGGHTPFDFDITHALEPDRATQTLVVRVEDDPLDLSKPRGKQDWQAEPHSIWYHRTTGIWQPVWLEAVPAVSIEAVRWTSDLPAACVRVAVRLSSRPAPGARLRITLGHQGERLASVVVPAADHRVEAVISLPIQRNGQGYEDLLWAPDQPRLLDAVVTLEPDVTEPYATEPDAAEVDGRDVVYSYLGLRSVAVDRGTFLLNDRPCYLRSVLSQGYWPESHLASPSADALRAEAQLIKDLGFNAARVHQKVEDPRFLFWADRLGLLVWGEAPSALEFTPKAVNRMIAEWTEVLERDSSHPCIVTWVPLNESWGVQHIAHDRAMQDYARTLFHLTKTLDPTRPVISNDGWEHLDSDIWSVHDYEAAAPVVRERYADAAAKDRLFAGMGPAGRRLRLSAEPDRGQPVMLTEFGGIQFAEHPSSDDAWGYSSASSRTDFRDRVSTLVAAVVASDFLAGFCYTQLTDTMQEANGLCDANRVPKLPLAEIARIIRGTEAGSGADLGSPDAVVELPALTLAGASSGSGMPPVRPGRLA
ncbi:glycoside hydrolase family 2 protein [Pengzhenrongella phosphoraccumulans]|uniref:glycoside hydrolase family 2 protein n=1 Tax=Pengzhenrongella phosphoraccumulans TaxID=3114394 RepID=UPI00388E4532